MTTPMERLRELELTPDLPRDELWEVISGAVLEVQERLEASKQARADASHV